MIPAEFQWRYDVPHETIDKLICYEGMVCDENRNQNLVSRSTLPDFWDRHILDSAQLIASAPADAALWLDVGTGAGLPGVVTALMTDAKHVWVEPRRRRADFLSRVSDELGLSVRVEIVQKRVEQVRHGPASVVTARAFATLTRTLEATRHLADDKTVWLLHKGRSVAQEVAEARRTWRGTIDQIPSITDSEAAIVKVRSAPEQVAA